MTGVQAFWVFVAGGVGSVARWLVSLACLAWFGSAFPYGTLAVNTGGCFLLAALVELAVSTDRVTPAVRLALGTGFLGGFTTYSTFNQETLLYLRDGATGLGLTYLAVTLLACLLAGLAGQAAARWLAGG